MTFFHIHHTVAQQHNNITISSMNLNNGFFPNNDVVVNFQITLAFLGVILIGLLIIDLYSISSCVEYEILVLGVATITDKNYVLKMHATFLGPSGLLCIHSHFKQFVRKDHIQLDRTKIRIKSLHER